ncbi:MAG TPA: hypothetical protein VLA16_02980, partial [Ideonella sp.]|nr:hypothetical protein [Ideonella sp.]
MNPSLFETRHGSDTALPLHRHGQPYAALVLAGEYLEFGPDGPVRCGPGSLVMHPPFHAHGNHFGRRGARVLNLALPLVSAAPAFSARQVPDLAVAREALGCGPAAPDALA